MSSQTGMSLTEVMIATALLAAASAGGLHAFARARMARADSAVTQQLHERAQYVLATLEPEIQMAGYFAHGTPPHPLEVASVPESAKSCGAHVVARIDIAIEALPEWLLSCAANADGAVPGSSVLIVRRAAASMASAPEPGRAQWFSDATAHASAKMYWLGEAPWSRTHISAGKELRDLMVRIFYVARTADGGERIPALRMKSLTSIAGRPAFIDTEVMAGVENLAVELSPPAAPTQSVRVALRVQSDPGFADRGALRTIEVSRRFAVRNVAP